MSSLEPREGVIWSLSTPNVLILSQERSPFRRPLKLEMVISQIIFCVE